MLTERTLYLPKADTAVEAEDAFHKVRQAFVREIANRFIRVGKAQIGDDWQAQIVREVATDDEIAKWTSPFDPSFVFSFPLSYPNAIVWRVLPRTPAFFFNYKKCRWVRNRWEHQQLEPSLQALREDLKFYVLAAAEADMEIQDALAQLVQRINSILDGTYSPNTAAEAAIPLPAQPDEDEARVAEEKEDAERLERERERERLKVSHARPRVGGAWIGPRPTRALKLKKQLNDLVDAETRQSVKHAWGDDAPLQIARLKMIDPMGDIFVDNTDGALFGFKHGEGYLLGYLGPEPERDLNEVQGFVLPHSYSLAEQGLLCETTSTYLNDVAADNARALTAVLRKAVDPLDELKITTHGDLFSLTEHGPVKVVRVQASDWFPGQLPG
jgi:hypothetical protein